jgi:kynurenine formamidase
MRRTSLHLVVLLGVLLTGWSFGQDEEAPGWKQGRGWGWIWGADDEVGALNAMTPATRLAALELVTEGKVYDLGITFSRASFVWPGHNKSEVMTFRSPDGLRRMGDLEFTLPEENPAGVRWHSCAVFISDNVATQIDALGHLMSGDPLHGYNGIPLDEMSGDFGVRRLSAVGIPPIVNRAVLLDIAGLEGVDALPASFAITPQHIDAAAKRQSVTLRVGDIVLMRTGSLRYWGTDGADHELLAAHDSAGITLATARYLIEEKGALALGSDTSGLEVAPAPPGSTTFVPVHEYLLVQQGVHLLEFHNLEELARDEVWEFCYMATTNKIAGITAGFALRPIALR